jgi:hypothetical protein
MKRLRKRSGDDSYKAELVLLAYYHEFIDIWAGILVAINTFMIIYYGSNHF